MGLIDGHVHLYPPATNVDPAAWAQASGETHWFQLCGRRRKDGRAVQSFPSLKDLLTEMDRAGVSRALLLGWYWERPATADQQNRFYAECVRSHPDRLSAFATLHPSAGRDASLAAMSRARDDGLCGLGELSPHAQGYACDEPVFRAVLDRAAEMSWPVNLHVTDPDSAPYPGRVATPLADFLALALAHPGTTFILAHWGGLLPVREPAARELGNLCYDTAASPLLYDESVWRKFLAVVPRDRVIFGSDFPLNVYPKIDAEPGMSRLVAELHRSGLGADDLAAIGRDNARRLLRLK